MTATLKQSRSRWSTLTRKPKLDQILNRSWIILSSGLIKFIKFIVKQYNFNHLFCLPFNLYHLAFNFISAFSIFDFLTVAGLKRLIFKGWSFKIFQLVQSEYRRKTCFKTVVTYGKQTPLFQSRDLRNLRKKNYNKYNFTHL